METIIEKTPTTTSTMLTIRSRDRVRRERRVTPGERWSLFFLEVANGMPASVLFQSKVSNK
jgi:hypothetical protein